MNYEDFVNYLEIPNVGMSGLSFVLEKHLNDIAQNGKLVLEFGVFKGTSITRIAKSMPTKTVYGFDSFEGLPEDWKRNDGSFLKGTFSLSSRLPVVPKNVTLIKGMFHDTLPIFLEEHKGEKVCFVHIDCDLYSSTKCILDILSERDVLDDRVIVVFDELVNYSTYKEHELKALYEFLEKGVYEIEWLGMKGSIVREKVVDFGAEYQSVACILNRKRG